MSEPQLFYQALGELFATLVSADDGTKFLEPQQGRYRTFVSLKVEKKYRDKYQEQRVYWRIVLPKFS